MGNTPAQDRFGLFIAALRLPFVSASALPYIAGSLLARPDFSGGLFLLGLLAAVATHLGANLLNDIGDSRSGVDWQDLNSYGFFGGSKLIQLGKLSERFYRHVALGCFSVAVVSVLGIAVMRNSFLPIIMLLAIAVLAAAYSLPPLRLSYRYLGEPVIFLLFGPALVMGGYFIQTGIFPSVKAFQLSLPFGLLVMTILFANEIPDYAVDRASGKRTWVAFTGNDFAYLTYGVLLLASLIAIGFNIAAGILSRLSAASLLAILPAVTGLNILKHSYSDKWRCVNSSRATILIFTGIAMLIIIDLLL